MRQLKAGFQSVDDVLTPLSTGFSENVMAMIAIILVAGCLYLIALPLFCWEGLNWIRSWEPVYVEGSLSGNVKMHLVSDDWYTAQQLPASSAATALTKETQFWEDNIKPPVLNALSAHFAVPLSNLTVGKINENRGDVNPGANSTLKYCDVTIPIDAKLGDVLSVEASVKKHGDALKALIVQNVKSTATWMAQLQTLDVSFDGTFTYKKDDKPKTDQVATGTPPAQPILQ